jgi:hypothetical protein
VATYSLSGRSSLACDDADTATARIVAAQMDPLRPTGSAATASVTLEPRLRLAMPFVDVQNPARDGVKTASDGERFLLVADGKACTVPDPLRDASLRFVYEAGFPVARSYARIIRPALQLSLHAADAVAIHASAVELDGQAVLVAGWSESGKTEGALALMEAGARFLSDKWTVLGGDGLASAFPVGVGIRRWVLPYLPRLAAGLPRAARRRLRLASVAASVSAPVRRRPGRAGAMAELAVVVADRAELTPSELRTAYGQGDDPGRRLPLAATAVLTTVPDGDVACEPADPAWAAARLARSAAFERRELFGLLERRRYAFPNGRGSALDEAVATETRILERALAQGLTFQVRAPFPVDPSRIAAAVSRAL